MPTLKKKKKVKRWSKVAIVGPLCVFNCNIAIKLWVMETELWKQSYYLPNKLFVMDPTIFVWWGMETENWVIKTSHSNGLL